MLFRQLFDTISSTYSYLLADDHGHALIIDPVRETVERDLELIVELGLSLDFVLETHVHADHVTAATTLRDRFGARTVVAKEGGVACADVPVADGDVIRCGQLKLEIRQTPGHTDGCVSYLMHHTPGPMWLFSGDALLIRGCGRTDFQHGDAHRLYRSVHDKIFSLPDDTLVYPAHDYRGRTVTTVGEEKRLNPRLGAGKSIDEFVAIMANLNLARPKLMDEAVPANLLCGMPEDGG